MDTNQGFNIVMPAHAGIQARRWHFGDLQTLDSRPGLPTAGVTFRGNDGIRKPVAVK